MTLQTHYDALMRQLEAYRKSDPLLYLHGLLLARDVTDPELRFVRAETLQALALKAQGAMRLCDFQTEIVLRPEGVFVNVGGLLLESSRSSMYFKAAGPAVAGEPISAMLHRAKIDVATAVDVGANFGEVSLALARDYPNARILAVEPSSGNLKIFEINKSVQRFSTRNIEIVRLAITDNAGVVALSKGPGTMNRVVTGARKADVENVPAERLDTLFDHHGIKTADFVKIDIEGSEPKLRDALVALNDRVRAYYIEFSQFAPFDDYVALAGALLALRFACYDSAMSAKLATTDDIAAHLRAAFAPSNIAVTNLWFIAVPT